MRSSTEAALMAIIVERYGAEVVAFASDIKWFIRDAVARAEYAKKQIESAPTLAEWVATREEDSEDYKRGCGTHPIGGGE